MRRANIFILTLVAGFLFLGCDNLPFLSAGPKKSAVPKPPIGATVVARVGSFYITAEDLDREVQANNALADQQGVPQLKIDTREKKLTYLRDRVVQRYMLYQEAIDRGLDKNEDVARTLEYAKMDLLVRQLMAEELQKIEVTDDEARDFYNKNKEALKEPEQRKILEIVTGTEDEAKQASIELLKGTDFTAVAKQFSKADTASKGGDLGFIIINPDPKQRIRFDKFYEVAFSPSLDAGQISSIFKGPDGKYYIVKVDSIKQSQVRPLTEMKDMIKNYLLTQKQNQVLTDLANRLAGQIKIEVYEGKVD